ncbi:MAG TPA: class I SAM-dependent methyltransferase [Mycobacteriales bacterium]|jgi:demethylmenaquinone methyltransferase/2-methoxy-6-polyprenyl-1,4-benzoquinol methylase|nr:class I SAM-dependent methyltransferase [Mycobacteriales bacterium]
MPRAQLDRQPREVARMFDAVADNYDRMNAVMTGGQERRWRRIVATTLNLRAGDLVLDLAAGTGASSASLQTSGATVVACDFSEGMLGVGRRRHPSVTFVAGDALRLPFRADTFSAVTISFGLRNVTDVDAALAELARVTAPRGRLAILETSAPRRQPMRAGHHFYVRRVMPRLARLVASNGEAYDYLAESMADWPAPQELAERIAAAGWGTVRWRQLMLGAVALHTGTR